MTKPHPQHFDPKPVLDLIASIEADLQRLKGLVEQQIEKFDPANPHNKAPDGKLTEEGVECCYRMPADAPAMKIDNVRRMGAEVVPFDRFRDDRMRRFTASRPMRK